MKLIIKFFCFILVLGVGGLFFINKPDGTPWLSLADLTPDISLNSVKSSIDEMVPDQLTGADSAGAVPVYRWQDAEGNWQYSDTPPPGLEVQQVMVGTDLNRDLAPEFSPQTKVGDQSSGGKAYFIKDSSNPSPSSNNVANPTQVTKLINDAKNVQKLMDNRQKQLEDTLSSSTHK